MSGQSHDTRDPAGARFVRPVIEDCWNRIGVRGDRSCVELERHVHCRNCPLYSAAARALLDAPRPPDDSAMWTSHFARPADTAQAKVHSVIVFRVSTEWFALPTALCSEVAEARAIHSLPHRRNGTVLGIANVRGELLVCLSLAAILGLDTDSHSERGKHGAAVSRLLVFRREAAVVFPATEVHGIHHYGSPELAAVPATVSRTRATHTRAMLLWRDRTIGLLDEQLLFHCVDRSLA